LVDDQRYAVEVSDTTGVEERFFAGIKKNAAFSAYLPANPYFCGTLMIAYAVSTFRRTNNDSKGCP
jgi:hypothetical protein